MELWFWAFFNESVAPQAPLGKFGELKIMKFHEAYDFLKPSCYKDRHIKSQLVVDIFLFDLLNDTSHTQETIFPTNSTWRFKIFEPMYLTP